MVQWHVSGCAHKLQGKQRDCTCPVLRCHWAIYVLTVCACVSCMCTSASCACIVHAWITSVLRVWHSPGKEAGGMLWRQGSHPLVCAVTSVESFLQQGAKGEDSRREQALFSVCVSVCLCASLGVSTMPTSSEAFLFSHVCFSIQQLVLTALIRQRLISVLRPERLYRCCWRYIVLNYTWAR